MQLVMLHAARQLPSWLTYNVSQVITIPITNPWHISVPPLYRFLEREYVDAFFLDGTLRLSSIKRFRKHADEQRLDREEGISRFFHRTPEGTGQTIMTTVVHDDGWYILSSSAVYDKAVAAAFRCDACIQIDDSTNFGVAISRHIPAFVAGIEGFCIYQALRVSERDVGGVINIECLSESDGHLSPEKTQALVAERREHWPLFLKSIRYRKQAEYRFAWKSSGPTSNYIDIKVPEARQFCSRPSSLVRMKGG